MKPATLLPFLLLVPACRSGESAPPAAAPEGLVSAATPASALVGALRALETLAELRAQLGPCQLRGLTLERVSGPAGRGELDRVQLELEVFAADEARARAAFDALQAALRERMLAPGEPAPPLSEHLRRGFVALDWSPEAPEGQVACSGTVQLELVPADPLPSTSRALATAGTDPAAVLALHVRTQAAQTNVGQLNLSHSMIQLAPGDELRQRLRIVPAERQQRYSLDQIAWFLAALEEQSPDSWLTRLTVEPWQGPGPATRPTWTFQAELSANVRVVPAASETHG